MLPNIAYQLIYSASIRKRLKSPFQLQSAVGMTKRKKTYHMESQAFSSTGSLESNRAVTKRCATTLPPQVYETASSGLIVNWAASLRRFTVRSAQQHKSRFIIGMVLMVIAALIFLSAKGNSSSAAAIKIGIISLINIATSEGS